MASLHKPHTPKFKKRPQTKFFAKAKRPAQTLRREMTNTIYFHQVNRDYWSASTSPNETPRPSFVDEAARENVEASSSSSSVVTGVSADLPSNHSSSSASTPWNNGGKLEPSNLKIFKFNELKAATNNFLPSNILGEGGFGPVFKGWIDEKKATATKPGEGTAVAIKMLREEGLQGHQEWSAEVNYLGKLYHPNLVRLIGHSFDNENRLLVYEFMPLGSLDNHLFMRGSCQLSWPQRMKIALEAAKGLAFLHRADINVIHRGVQCSNIHLDSNYNAKLSDFGLSMDGPTGDMSHVSTAVMGTYGYAAPEYIATGHLTSKNDVYCFGVTLLEIISGRKVMDMTRPSGEHNLVEWAKPYLTKKHQYSRVVDRQLEGKYSSDVAQKVANLLLQCLNTKADRQLEGKYSRDVAQKVANLVFQCLNTEPKSRPNMDEVVMELEQLQDNVDM